MAATFDGSDPSSPSFYKPSETALLLLDFQNLTVQLCGDDGKAGLANAKTLRNWALAKGILVLHSIIDAKTAPRSTAKNPKTMDTILSMAKDDLDAANEPQETAADPANGDREVVVFKQLGFVSGLKSKGAMDVLKGRGIKSVVVCGLATSGAVLGTALAAADEEFVVTVVEDACADRVEGLHDVLLRDVLGKHAHVCSVGELVGRYGH